MAGPGEDHPVDPAAGDAVPVDPAAGDDVNPADADPDVSLAVVPVVAGTVSEVVTASAAVGAVASHVRVVDPVSSTTSKILRILRSVDKSLKFDFERARNYVDTHKFNLLEEYVKDTLAKVHSQGELKSEHPGLLWIIHRAEIEYFIGEGKIDDAALVWNHKVQELLKMDKYFSPKNFATQLQEAHKWLKRADPPRSPDLVYLIWSYFELYFPSLLDPTRERTASVNDFVAVREVDGVAGTHCLACGYILPSNFYGEVKLSKHYTRDAKVKMCSDVSDWMTDYLQAINTVEGADLIREKAVKKTAVKSRKRKQDSLTSLQSLPGYSFVVTKSLLNGILELQVAICTALWAMDEEEEEAKSTCIVVRKLLDTFGRNTSELFKLAISVKTGSLGSDHSVYIKAKDMVGGMACSALQFPELTCKLKKSSTAVQSVSAKVHSRTRSLAQ